MPKDPFLILGVSSDATQAEIDSAYNTLRDKYNITEKITIQKL